MAAGGCGSSGSSGHARTLARTGCQQVLGIGQALTAHQPASGTGIDQQLHAAEANLDQASSLDHQYQPTATALHQLVQSLEAGQAPGNDVTVHLTNGCRPFDTAAGA